MKTKNSSKEVIKTIFVCLTLFIVYSLSFLHFGFTKLSDWSPYKTHYKNYSKIINTNTNEEKTLLKNLENKSISVSQYVDGVRKSKLKMKDDLREYHIKKKELKNEYSFLGYSSFRYFLYSIGLPILCLASSILLLIFTLNPNNPNKLKRFYIITSLGFIYVSSFWISYSVFAKTDFPEWLYNLSYIILAIISTVIFYTIVYFFSNRNNVIEKLVSLIVSIKNKHYPEVLARVLYAEKKSKNYSLTKTAKELATEFDNEIVETFNSIEK